MLFIIIQASVATSGICDCFPFFYTIFWSFLRPGFLAFWSKIPSATPLMDD